MVKKVFIAVSLSLFLFLPGCSMPALSGTSVVTKITEPSINVNKGVTSNTIAGNSVCEDEKTEEFDYEMMIRKQNNKAAVKTGENNKVVYLTFDDGPSVLTEGFLNVLKENNVRATFCVIGERVEAFKDVIKREHQEGHSVINHSNTHNLSEIYKSSNTFTDNIEKCNSILNSIIDRSDIEKKFIRFPGGCDTTYMKDSRQGITGYMKSKGYDTLEWNISSGDCATGKATTDYIYQNSIKDNDRDVVVILMHDFKYRQTTLDALPKIIKHYRDKGYSFKTIKDMSSDDLDKLVSKKIVNKIYAK